MKTLSTKTIVRAMVVPWVLVLTLMVLSGCETVKEKTEDLRFGPPPPVPFEPTSYISRLYAGEGRYNDLFTPDSYGVWVGKDVAAMKYEQAAEKGDVDPELELVAAHMTNEFLVFECHVASRFGDSSMAFDAVRFRNTDVYLVLPDGTEVDPIRVLVGHELEEKQVGALKEFRRTNVVLFSKPDLLIPHGDQAAVRLVMEGVAGAYFFEFTHAGPPPEQKNIWTPKAKEAGMALKLRFQDLYGVLRDTAHTFD